MIPHSSPAKLSGLTAGSPQSAHSEIRMKNITLSEIESMDKLARAYTSSWSFSTSRAARPIRRL
jgi:hypothetical protein